ncbi:hypothetical protein HBI56_074940 [Parastagonospora nodorum]|uniref:Uncharacterized protein n=1 Tax=Phaeosphaeria nodorum (strain SN15 / ATCC MYA-4574 / FGSC 10173) TaxID=321614 RepID=A0A7U2EX98_PHANO|nr:hypothetical protein HBH56_170060 [Parastagonospora nodorum]QRC94417.1 hypothetical protein JI435_076620 [Parastagonospora nodorum SN15]KAH3928289.1 hypothetical protein HBH54_138610 [Parastagonospora nodorum]KAH3945463.1 hypothetical protein HBH53_143960 [Parastagonospora nodorum]KAH3983640.1 hypothetical protein HBH52_060270 [Parastagonospora nodorum]
MLLLWCHARALGAKCAEIIAKVDDSSARRERGYILDKVERWAASTAEPDPVCRFTSSRRRQIRGIGGIKEAASTGRTAMIPASLTGCSIRCSLCSSSQRSRRLGCCIEPSSHEAVLRHPREVGQTSCHPS